MVPGIAPCLMAQLLNPSGFLFCGAEQPGSRGTGNIFDSSSLLSMLLPLQKDGHRGRDRNAGLCPRGGSLSVWLGGAALGPESQRPNQMRGFETFFSSHPWLS